MTPGAWLQRLTFECGHHRLSGPWNADDHPARRRLVGDVTWCGVCPRAPDVDFPGRRELRLRQVVEVAFITSDLYHAPDEAAERALAEQDRREHEEGA